MTQPLFGIDPALKEWATDRQKEFIDAIELHGSASAAGRVLGVDKGTICKSIANLKKRAAHRGYAPGHFKSGVAPGFAMGKVTVQRAGDGSVERTWERQSPDDAHRLVQMQATLDAMCENIKPVPAMTPPALTAAALANFYTLTDYHFGMAARKAEGGADWNLEIAEDLLVRLFENLISRAPAAGTAVFNQMGDLFHFDGLLPVTPTHGHIMDVASRYEEMVKVVIRALRRVIAMLLAKHQHVHIIMAEGNHDLASSAWLRQMFAVLYESEPRVTVDTNPLPYYAYRWGTTLLAVHHGHKTKKQNLPLLFAAMFRELWGQTIRCHIHVGHEHHVDEKEYPGCKVIQHATVAAPDSHTQRGGWMSEREMSVMTYHDQTGPVGRTTATPEMLAA